MCGIAGYFSPDKTLTPDLLREGNRAQSRRGPDAEGVYFSSDLRVGLAHRRLSIIDLSAGANQPMYSNDGRYVIVFNGEIYNFKELRKQLPDQGASLRTTSDTEVLLNLYIQRGSACFRELNGMFAFAIYDTGEKKLLLCRDHTGIKPLFYYCDGNEFIFASELKVIAAIRKKRLRLNKGALPAFFHLGFIPEPQTIYEHTGKFPAAHFAEIDCSQRSINAGSPDWVPFWNLNDKISATPLSDKKKAKAQLHDLLKDSVEKQLISDVPIGTFLSGGVDSSLVTALAASLNGHRHVDTFSMSIDEGKYNEGKYAQAVSKQLGTRHHEFRVKEKDVLEMLDDLIPTYDEPFADSSAFPTLLVSSLARKHVTVVLSGDGGDELFHGYGMYRWAEKLSHPLVAAFRKPIYRLSSYFSSRVQRAGQLFDYAEDKPRPTHIFSQEQYFFKENELSGLLRFPHGNFDALNHIQPTLRKLTPAEIQSLWDYGHYLKDDLLVKIDRASMRHSLECRVPLLDHRVAEFAVNLHPSLKIQGGTMKYLLKEVLYEYLPEQLFDRPKWGFSIPLAKWLGNELSFLVECYANKSTIEKYGLLNHEAVEKIKTDFRNGATHLYNRLWLVIVLHWWLEQHEGISVE
jgi:asparagine synthase (glutamine-hydrolysing)